IRSELRREAVEIAFFQDGRDFTGLYIQLLEAEGGEREKMSFAIPAHASGLINDAAAFAGDELRGRVERISFGEFLQTALAGQFDADVSSAVLVQDAEDHIAGFPRDIQMPDTRPVVIPQPGFFRSERGDSKQGAKAAAFQRVQEVPRIF